MAAPARLADYPNLPTIAESGYPGFEVNAWCALYAPAKTPAAVVARLSAELSKALKQPGVADKLNALAVKTQTSTPQELARVGQTELEKYGELIRAGNIQID